MNRKQLIAVLIETFRPNLGDLAISETFRALDGIKDTELEVAADRLLREGVTGKDGRSIAGLVRSTVAEIRRASRTTSAYIRPPLSDDEHRKSLAEMRRLKEKRGW